MQLFCFAVRERNDSRCTVFRLFCTRAESASRSPVAYTLAHIALGALERSKFMPRSDAQFSLQRFFSFWQRARFAHRAHQCGILLFAKACVPASQPASGLGVWPFSSPSRSPPLNCIRTVLWDWSVTCAASQHHIKFLILDRMCREESAPFHAIYVQIHQKCQKNIC